MKRLIFLDTETTGNDILSDRLFQVAYKYDGKIHSEYFKPAIPISVKAQSITHVTNKMVDDKEAFSYSDMKKDLQILFKDNILVAHNAQFDIEMLEKEGVKIDKYICTLKVARFLDADQEIPEYNMQYLRYFWELDVEAKAHDAVGDVMVLEAVFKRMYEKMLRLLGSSDAVIEKMIEISKKPSLFQVFNFGKHRGKRIEEVALYDRSYLEWMLDTKMQSTIYDEDWIFSLKYHLKIE